MSAAKGNGLTAGNSQPAKAQNTNAAIVAPAQKIGNLHAKRLATLIAQFALKGHVVHKTDGNDFLVTRWNLTRYCADFAALQAFARQVGVKS